MLLIAAAAAARSASGNTPYTYDNNTDNFSTGFTPTAVSSTTTELDFGGSGTAGYTATNDAGPFVLNAMNLNSGSTATEIVGPSVAANLLNFNGTSPVLTQLNSGAFNISAGVSLGSTLLVNGPGTGAVTLSGPVTGAGGITFNNSAGVLNLTGANSYTGATNLISGTVNFSGTATQTTSANLDVGSTPGGLPAVVNVSTSGNLTFASALNVGDNGSSGAVTQTGGTVQAITTGGNYLMVGNDGYGSYTLSGGTLLAGTSGDSVGIRVGGNQNGLNSNGVASVGVLTQTGGSITTFRYLAIGTGPTTGTGVATFTGGTTLVASGFRTNIEDGTSATGVMNLGTEAGGNAVFTTGTNTAGIEVHAAGGAGSATLNVNAGTLILPGSVGIQQQNAGVAVTNLNGGILQSGTVASTIITSLNSMAVPVYNGGAIFNVSSAAAPATVAANLLGTTGSGIYAPGGTLAVPSGSGGTGYIGAPAVTVSGGGVTGTNVATAIANISNGQIVGVTLTSPGQGYTPGSTVTFAFTGGGTGTVAPSFNYTFGATSDPALAANGTGGLTKIGPGTLLLSGTNTYTGVTKISAGILEPTVVAALPVGTSTVAAGAALYLPVGGTNQFSAGSIATALGTATFATGSNLGIDTAAAGTAGFTYGSPITGPQGLVKLGTNPLFLTGANTYSGPTNVSAGTLVIGPTGSLGNTAITVGTAAVLAPMTGAGTVTAGSGAASLTLNAGSSFNMADGAIGTFRVAGAAGTTGLSVSSTGASAVNLTFDLGPTSADQLSVTGLAALTGTNAVINVNALTSDTSLTSGNYTLISTSGGNVPADYALSGTSQNVTINGTVYHLSLANSNSTAEILSVSQISGSLPNAFWAGSINGTWSTNQSGSTNFRTDASSNIDTGKLPDGSTNVVFTVNGGGANLNTTLGSDFSINSLSFNGNANGPVTIGGTNTLTINATTLNGNAAGNGINMSSGSSAVTISAGVALGGNQVWTNNSTNPLIVSGVVSGASSLVYAGSATLTLSGANTFTGGFNTTGGSLNLNSSTALGSGPFVIGGSLVLDNTSGSPVAMSTSNTQAWNGDIVFNGTNDLNMGNGLVTLGGARNLTLNAGNLSVGGITDNGLGYSLTTTGAGNLSANGSITGGISVNVNGTGGLTVTGASSTYTGTTNISGGGFVTFANASNTALTGTVNVSTGTLNVTGSSNLSGGTLLVGGSLAGGRGVMNINTTGSVIFNLPSVGGVAGAAVGTGPVPAGAINQINGTVHYAPDSNQGGGYLELGTGPDTAYGTAGGYGSYNLAGGTLTGGLSASGIRVGSQGIGIFTQSAGTVNMSRYFSLGLNGLGIATFTGGTFNGSAAFNIIVGDHDGIGYMNVGTLAGGNALIVSQSNQAGGGLLVAGNTTINTGVLNLNSGTVQELAGSINSHVTNPAPAVNAIVNWNGATIQAGANNLTLLDASLNTNTTAAQVEAGSPQGNIVYLYNGNAVVDTMTNTATISANLYGAQGSGLYPTSTATGGVGVLNLPGGSGGSGYIGQPAVFVSGGSGNGIMAVANMGANGTITGVSITNPGQGYQPGDQITFSFNADGSLAAQGLTNVNGAPIAPASSFTYTVGSGDPNLAVNNGGLTKVGTGTLVLTGINVYTGGTNVSAGTLNLAVPGALPAGNNLSVGSTATALFASHSGTTVSVQQLKTLTLAGATNAWTGKVDLTNNDLDIQSGSLATITNQVAAGYNLTGGANWKGLGGITSSTAAGNSSHLTAVGVILNNVNGNQIYGSGTALGLFDKTNPGAGDVLVKYTYFGDANLDGKVDGSDYSLIDGGYASHGSLTGWFNGDFNYDGVVDGSDYALLDNAFNNQGTTLTSAAIVATATAQVAGVSTSAVPEPASVVLLTIGAVAGLARRRRTL